MPPPPFIILTIEGEGRSVHVDLVHHKFEGLFFLCVEMKEEHIFKKYSPGEPSVRLYLKNLARQVDEKVEHIMCYDYSKYRKEC